MKFGSRPGDTAPIWRALGVRVVCLARLNGFAWTLSRYRKSSRSPGPVAMDCRVEGGALNKTQARVRQFHDACARLGRSTRALWVPSAAPASPSLRLGSSPRVPGASGSVFFTLRTSRRPVPERVAASFRQGDSVAARERPGLCGRYEAVKDGSPRQAASLRTLLRFLGLSERASIAAETTHHSHDLAERRSRPSVLRFATAFFKEDGPTRRPSAATVLVRPRDFPASAGRARRPST